MLRKVLLCSASIIAVGAVSCNTMTNCDDCTTTSTWVPGQHCRWCTSDHKCHSEFSVINPCRAHQNIYNESKCSGQPPAPVPVPPKPRPPSNSIFTKKVLTFIFSELHITDINVDKCVADVGGAEVSFKDFGADLKTKPFSLKAAVVDLSRGLSSLSNSVAGCGVPEVQQKLDALAASIRWANISTAGLDKSVKILVGASELWNDITKVAAAVRAEDPTAVGRTLATLLKDWTSVTGGCKGNKACQILDGLLRILGVTATNVAPCEAALEPALTNFTAGAAAIEKKDFKTAVAEFATGLDVLAKATAADSCGLKDIADAIGDLSPKLAAAVINVENSTAVRIIVGAADVYTELYSLVMDLKNHDYAGVGMELGALLAKLRASGCHTIGCIVMDGLLGSLQIGFSDLRACAADARKEYGDIESIIAHLKTKKWKIALDGLGDLFNEMGKSVHDCGVPQLGAVLEDAAKKLHLDSVANVIQDVVQVLVGGADIMPDIQKIIVDSENHSWSDLGKDLGVLSDWISGTKCNSFVCHLIEGILTEAGMALIDLKPCEAKLREAETDFVGCAQLIGQGKPLPALQYCATGLNNVAQSVDACGIAKELSYIEQEANVLGLGNVSIIGDIVKIIVHGSDFYETFYNALMDIENHDYRSAGSEIGKMMSELSQWTVGHLCTSPVCYVVNGVMQYLNDLGSDFKKCKSDFPETWNNLSFAWTNITDIHDGHFRFNKNKTQIKIGVNDLGKAFTDMSNIVGDCHLVELAHILMALAVKLGLSPVVEYIDFMLKILIEGVSIEREIGQACSDWTQHNWPGFGYNIMEIIKQLLTKEEFSALLQPKAIYI